MSTYTMQTCIPQPRMFLHVYVLSDPYFHLDTLRLDSPTLGIKAIADWYLLLRFFWYYTAHLIHLSQWHLRPFLLTMSSRGPTRTVVKAYYLTPGAYFIDSRLSSSLSDTPKWLTVCFFFRIRLLLHQMGTPSPPCFALFVLIERIESQSLNGLRTAA